MIATAQHAPSLERARCPFDGAALIRVTRLEGREVAPLEASFLCGHSITAQPPVVKQTAPHACAQCGTPIPTFPDELVRPFKCDDCLGEKGRKTRAERIAAKRRKRHR